MRKLILLLAVLSIINLSYSQKVDTLNVYSASMQKAIKSLIGESSENFLETDLCHIPQHHYYVKDMKTHQKDTE